VPPRLPLWPVPRPLTADPAWYVLPIVRP